MKTTERSKKLTPFFVMELLEQARAMEAGGDHIVHMEIGEPDFPTPKSVKIAAREAIENDRTFYTHSLGIPELRKLIADYYEQQEGVHISSDRVIITNGTSGAFLLLASVLLEKDRVLAVSDPGYPCYKNFAALFDARLEAIPVSEESLFEIPAERLMSIETVPDVLIISNPSNPTGTVYRESSLIALNKALKKSKSTLIVDEIYRGLYYDKRIPTAVSLSNDTIIVDGFSKVFAMTGWRLGWMVVPEELVRPIQIVAQNVFISPPTISQYAAMSAFSAMQETAHMRTSYQKRRNFLLPELRKLGFRINVEPEGAFYIYAGIELWGMDSREFTNRALREAKVAITPGYDFGTFRAGAHVRFSYATGIDDLQLGCNRLENWIKTL